MVKKTNKKSNLKRNIKGPHKGKKSVTPYKFYMDRDEIIKKKHREYLVDKIIEMAICSSSDTRKVGEVIRKHFKDIDLSELTEEDFNRRIK